MDGAGHGFAYCFLDIDGTTAAKWIEFQLYRAMTLLLIPPAFAYQKFLEVSVYHCAMMTIHFEY